MWVLTMAQRLVESLADLMVPRKVVQINLVSQMAWMLANQTRKDSLRADIDEWMIEYNSSKETVRVRYKILQSLLYIFLYMYIQC